MVLTRTRAMRSALAAAAICLVAAATLFALGRPAGAADQNVSISGLAYNPANVTINVGDTVTWTNNDAGVQHTVTSPGGNPLSSGLLNQNQSYAHTFTTAGTFIYGCTVHPTMTGQVVVQQVGGSPTTTTTTTTVTTTTTPATNTATATSATGTATSTPTQTATLTPTQIATFTATATFPAATSTPTSVSTALPATVTITPGPPATGESVTSGSSAPMIAGTLAIMAAIGFGGAAFALRGSRNS